MPTTTTNGSYQKNNGETAPLRIEELGAAPQDYAQRKRRRQLLFSTISVVLIVICLIFLVSISHLTRPHPNKNNGGGNDGNDGNNDDDTLPTTTTTWMQKLDVQTGGDVPTGCESTVLILRHCEKYGPETTSASGDRHCSYVGHERAEYLSTLFGNGNDGNGNGNDVSGNKQPKWPVPSVLYALGIDRGHHLNFRQIETLRPLANKFDLTINAKYTTNEDLIEAYSKLLSSGNICGKVVVVSWKHEYIPDLARQLTCPDCTPKSYDSSEFDEVWQLKYVYDTKGTRVYKKLNNNDDEGNINNDSGNGDDEVEEEKEKVSKRRMLKRIREKHWTVYFAKSAQGFDPLSFSALSGDYGSGAPEVGGSWLGSEM